MKKVLRLLMSAAFLAALLMPLRHRHAAPHDGILAPHIDCTICGWTQGNQSPSLSSAKPVFSKQSVSFLIIPQKASSAATRTAASFLSRAPPQAS